VDPARGNAAQVPEINRLAVLRSISRRGSFTKMDVVREAHLSLPTVNDILLSLGAGGYVVPSGNGESRGGRPPALFQFNPRARYAAGIEVRIPSIAIGLVDLAGRVEAMVSYPFDDASTSDYVEGALAQGVERVMADRDLEPNRLIGIGVGVPGFVERDTGVWLGFPRVPLISDLPVRALLARRFGVPVYMQNEINVWALAELQKQPAPVEGDLLVITCTEGLKASVVVDGRILAGDHGDFGSVGHFIVVNDGRPCFCGARGCLESYASGQALRQAVRAMQAQGPGHPAHPAHPAFPDLNDPALPGRVFALAAAGDPLCRGIVEEAIPLMAYAFASLIRLTDIDRVVLLGAYVEGGEWLRMRLHERIAQRLPEVMRRRLSIRLGARLSAEDILAAAALPAIRAHLGTD
jgi:predicted NBD/HSP70 family sugar kinase